MTYNLEQREYFVRGQEQHRVGGHGRGNCHYHDTTIWKDMYKKNTK